MSGLARRRFWSGSFCALLLSAVGLPAGAETQAGGERWQWGAQLYLWAAGMSGTTVTGDEIDVSFSDVVDSLDVGLMGTVAASRGKWTLFADLLYTDLSEDATTTARIVGLPVKAGVDISMKSAISTLGVTHRVLESEAGELNVLAGARYLSLSTDLDFRIGPLRPSVSDSDVVWDGVIGVRGTSALNDRWYLSYYLDVGAGGSDLTWQAVGGINYRFSRFDAALGYRHVAWELDDTNLMGDLEISGPYTGVRLRF
jgi:hypothetical protein